MPLGRPARAGTSGRRPAGAVELPEPRSPPPGATRPRTRPRCSRRQVGAGGAGAEQVRFVLGENQVRNQRHRQGANRVGGATASNASGRAWRRSPRSPPLRCTSHRALGSAQHRRHRNRRPAQAPGYVATEHASAASSSWPIACHRQHRGTGDAGRFELLGARHRRSHAWRACRRSGSRWGTGRARCRGCRCRARRGQAGANASTAAIASTRCPPRVASFRPGCHVARPVAGWGTSPATVQRCRM